MRVIDALQLPEVMDGSKWIALKMPHDLILPTQTIGVNTKTLRMYWCDRISSQSAVAPSYFGSEAALTLPQLLGECTLIDKRG